MTTNYDPHILNALTLAVDPGPSLAAQLGQLMEASTALLIHSPIEKHIPIMQAAGGVAKLIMLCFGMEAAEAYRHGDKFVGFLAEALPDDAKH